MSFRLVNLTESSPFLASTGSGAFTVAFRLFLSISTVVVYGFPSAPVYVISAIMVSGNKFLLNCCASLFKPSKSTFTSTSICLDSSLLVLGSAPTDGLTISSLNSILEDLSCSCGFASCCSVFSSTLIVTLYVFTCPSKVTFTSACCVTAVEVSTVPTNSTVASAGRFSNAERGSAFSPTFTLIGLTFNSTCSSCFEDWTGCVEVCSSVDLFVVSAFGAACCSAASFVSAFGVVIAACGLVEFLLVVTKDPVDLSNLTCTSSFDASCVAFEVV